MKQRIGFVSNSSSCSFCIYGIFVPPERVAEICDPESDREFKPELKQKLDDAGFTSLEIVTGQDGGEYGIYVGRDIFDQSMDETRREFQGRIEQAVKIIFPENTPECSVKSESWYDG